MGPTLSRHVLVHRFLRYQLADRNRLFRCRIMGLGLFASRPNCRQLCALLGRTIARNAKPKDVICDRDGIFDCRAIRPTRMPRFPASMFRSCISPYITLFMDSLCLRFSQVIAKYDSRSTGTMSTDLTKRLAARRGTKSVSHNRQRTSSRALSPGPNGLVNRPVQSRRSTSTANPATRSSSRSTATRIVDICPFYVLAVWREHCQVWITCATAAHKVLLERMSSADLQD